MKPILILQRGIMKPAEIKKLNDNDLCVVEADDPAKVRFLDPIPAAASRTAIEDAAIKLSRKLLSPGHWRDEATRDSIAKTYVDILVHGTKLDPNGTREEQEQAAYDEAHYDETRKIAREDARAARAASAAQAARVKAATDAAAAKLKVGAPPSSETKAGK